MTITLSLDWWLAPAIVTAICLLLMVWPRSRKREQPTYGDNWTTLGIGLLFDGLNEVFRLFWIIPILVAWLIYFIFN